MDMTVSTEFHPNLKVLSRLYLRRVIQLPERRVVPPTERILPPQPRNSDDITISRIETKQESGEVPPADVVVYLMPGVRMCLGSRRVRKTALQGAAMNHTGNLLYRGLVPPAKEDIQFLVSEQHGIQAIYNKASSVDEPMLMDNQVPTITTVYFMRLTIVHNVVQAQLEQERRRTQHRSSQSSLKRQREDTEEHDRQAKRAKIDRSKLPYIAMLLATGIAVKYLL